MIADIKKKLHNTYPYWLSFLLPVGLMLAYFISRSMYPFGSSSLLTVDLGQQYIDFFAFYRHALLHSPTSFFYSFSKAIGGNMLGEWAYYLLSPFNLIFLFFPDKRLLTGVMLVTLLKYGCAGLSFAYLLTRLRLGKRPLIPAFATCYALMGWGIANQLNLLWLDVLVFLPLVVTYLILLLQEKQHLAYSLWLALLIISNYYMGYMVCIFLVLFFAWYELTYTHHWQKLARDLWLFTSRSLLGAGLAGVILLPTLYSLTTSKGTYTETTIHWTLEYQPLKMITKFIIGAFNFNQMPKGFPNLFVGSCALFGFILYFCLRHISWREKLATGLVSTFLILSLCFEPLDLLWHGMQFPVWYPYRFSYIVSFWIIFIACRAFSQTQLNLTWSASALIIILYGGMIAYTWLYKAKFDYLTASNIIITGLLGVVTLMILWLDNHSQPLDRIKCGLLFLVMVVEIFVNATNSLKNISYLSVQDYTLPSTALKADSTYLHHHDSSWYRVAQTYERTKNDGLAHNLNAGSYFSSALEKSIPDFYGQIGQPDGDNYVTYTGGTAITDALMDYKYYLTPQDVTSKAVANVTGENVRVQSMLPLYGTKNTLIYKNSLTTSIAYAASPLIKKIQTLYNNPVAYQTNWLNAVSASMPSTTYFTAANFDLVSFTNVKEQTTLTGANLTKITADKAAQVNFRFKAKTNNTYYITLGSGLDKDNVDLYLNGHPLRYYSTFRHTVIVPLASHAKGQTFTLSAHFKKNSLWLNDFVLYQMNDSLVKQKIKQVQKHTLHIQRYNAHQIMGTIAMPNGKILTTTIPYDKGWHIQVDGKKVTPYQVQNTFLAFNVAPGKHRITMTYWPPLLGVGLLVTITSLAITSYLYWRRTH